MARKPAVDADRQSIGIRPKIALKKELERIASENNRSLAQEVERRLEQSLAGAAPSFEDVRLMIREEIRAALADNAVVVAPHAHTFRDPDRADGLLAAALSGGFAKSAAS